MTDHIISRALIRKKGMAAFHAGHARNGHNMNPGAAAIEEWQSGWDEALLSSLCGPASNAPRCVDCRAVEGAAHDPDCSVSRYV